MQSDKRVFTRDEFTEMLMDRVDDITKIGPTVEFVESVLRLQNDMGRPVYVFEVADGISQKDVEYIDEMMSGLGLACCLVPKGLMGYVGEVTSDSFGVENLKSEVLGWKRKEGTENAGNDA